MRKVFTLTDEQYERLLAAGKPVRDMIFDGQPPRSPQENADAAWAELGAKMGFDYMSVKLISELTFTAEVIKPGHRHTYMRSMNKMTHSGGQLHAVGYMGQQYEVSVYDESAEARRVVGWTNDAMDAIKLSASAAIRPSWTFSWVTDLYSDISHTQNCEWIGERPLPSNKRTTPT